MMGIKDQRFLGTTPLHEVKLNGFWSDKTEVTNTPFQKFVDATGYVTVSVRVSTAEEFINALPKNLKAGSAKKYYSL